MTLEALIRQGRDLIMSGRYGEAVSTLTKVINDDAIDPHSEQFTTALSYRAFAKDGLGEWDDAYADLTRLIELHPDAEVNRARAGILSKMGRYREAIDDLEIARRKYSLSPEIHVDLGDNRRELGKTEETEKNNEEAERNYRMAIQLGKESELSGRITKRDYVALTRAEVALKAMGKDVDTGYTS